MFGKNEIVGKKFFNESEEAKAGKLLVTSMFYTLQGEGPYRGEPAFFIRLAKCNLNCSFCDTFFDTGEWLSLPEIEERIETEIVKFFSPDCGEHDQGSFQYKIGDKLVWKSYDPESVPDWARCVEDSGYKRNMVLVITGGEPTLQANLKELLDWGATAFAKTQIESNGLGHLPGFVTHHSTTVVISPKCHEKTRTYIKPNDATLERADCLKFVMEAPWPDWEKGERVMRPAMGKSPYSYLPAFAIEWQKRTGKPIFVSPMNEYLQLPAKAKALRSNNETTTIEQRSYSDEVVSFWEEGMLDMKANKRNHEYAAWYAIRNNCIFGVQIHLLASVA